MPKAPKGKPSKGMQRKMLKAIGVKPKAKKIRNISPPRKVLDT